MSVWNFRQTSSMDILCSVWGKKMRGGEKKVQSWHIHRFNLPKNYACRINYGRFCSIPVFRAFGRLQHVCPRRPSSWSKCPNEHCQSLLITTRNFEEALGTYGGSKWAPCMHFTWQSISRQPGESAMRHQSGDFLISLISEKKSG